MDQGSSGLHRNTETEISENFRKSKGKHCNQSHTISESLADSHNSNQDYAIAKQFFRIACIDSLQNTVKR